MPTVFNCIEAIDVYLGLQSWQIKNAKKGSSINVYFRKGFLLLCN
jgi:hypothetical protein